MVFDGSQPKLTPAELPVPTPLAGQVLVKVEACGVCRTDLHVVDGELTYPALPLIPGHEIVGRVVTRGDKESGFEIGQRVGVPWLGHTCGCCTYCVSGQENLCDAPKFTGYTINGGFAEYCVADEHFVFALPENAEAQDLAPLLCAGLIGYRSFKIAGPVSRLGIYGFGAAAHILCQIASHQNIEVFAFSRDGDHESQKFAIKLGARWAGSSLQSSPVELDAAIIFAPVGELVPRALKVIRKGGKVVCAGIHMSDIPCFPYHDLWQERSICSVANLTREDGEEFFPLAAQANVRTHVTPYPLQQANTALDDLRAGRIQGAAVLTI